MTFGSLLKHQKLLKNRFLSIYDQCKDLESFIENYVQNSKFGPTPPRGPSEFSKSLTKVKDFANKNPVAALATYDLGKGVLGKILNTRQLAPGVVGGTVGRRSARGGGGL